MTFKEPATGPMSYLCYCRRMTRRMNRLEKTPNLYPSLFPQEKKTLIPGPEALAIIKAAEECYEDRLKQIKQEIAILEDVVA